MALINLSTISNYWKNISDYILGIDTTSSPRVTVSNPLPVGTNVIGKFGIDQTTNGVVVKSNTQYLSNISTITLDTDTAIPIGFTAQKITYIMNIGSDIVISFDTATSTVGKSIILKDGEGINDVNLVTSVLNARLSVAGGSASLSYMFVG